MKKTFFYALASLSLLLGFTTSCSSSNNDEPDPEVKIKKIKSTDNGEGFITLVGWDEQDRLATITNPNTAISYTWYDGKIVERVIDIKNGKNYDNVLTLVNGKVSLYENKQFNAQLEFIYNAQGQLSEYKKTFDGETESFKCLFNGNHLLVTDKNAKVDIYEFSNEPIKGRFISTVGFGEFDSLLLKFYPELIGLPSKLVVSWDDHGVDTTTYTYTTDAEGYIIKVTDSSDRDNPPTITWE